MFFHLKEDKLKALAKEEKVKNIHKGYKQFRESKTLPILVLLTNEYNEGC